MQDDIPFDSIEGTEDDELDPQAANGNEDSIFSGGDPDDTDTNLELEEE